MTAYDDPRCADCRVDTFELDEWYMVTHDIWAAHGAEDGALCIGCLERRLGRRLVGTDFLDVPLNDPEECAHSARLRDRLGRD